MTDERVPTLSRRHALKLLRGATAGSALALAGLPAVEGAAAPAFRFAPGWTHVVGAPENHLVFYNRANRALATGVLTDDGVWFQTSQTDVGAGWTHMANGGERRLLFYQQSTGKGLGGDVNTYFTGIDRRGHWGATTRYGW